MNRIIRSFGLCVACVGVLNVLGCGTSQPAHFYLLRAMSPDSDAGLSETKASSLSLGLGPISLPKYLDRPQIVTRISSHEIDLAEFHNWGAPLKDNLVSVLHENLSKLLATNRIVEYPWNRSHLPDYQLSLEVLQFDGTKNQEAVLSVRWRLTGDDGKRVLQEKTSQFSEIIQGSDYEDLVEAMSRMLALLSREIADAITVLSPLGS